MTDGAPGDDWLRHVTSWSFGNARPLRLGVAVSGGGDSMALLDLMAWQGRNLGFPVEAATVDHGLRPESAREAALVARFCGSRGIPHQSLRWTDRPGGGNLQAAAREARYRLLSGWAADRGIDWIALGHTRDDQAETVLMRLARRAGVDGLAGMAPQVERNGLTWIRPLLGESREDLRAYLTRRGIDWAEDASNEDDRFERVRARKALRVLAPLGIDGGALSAVAVNAQDARRALQHYTRLEAARIVTEDRGDLILQERPIPPIPEEIRRRLRIAAIRWINGAAYPPRATALLDLDIALAQAHRHTLAGCLFLPQRGLQEQDVAVRVTREWNAVKDVTAPTDAVWDNRWQLDGPHAPDLTIRALGEGVTECPDWRATGLPRDSLRASPAVWRGNLLVAAPLAGHGSGWTASLTEHRRDFARSLL